MEYEKQTWAYGDEISAEKLNHMEDGIESANSGGGTASEPLIIRDTEETVKDPVGHSHILTDTLATDAYEAWQSGRPIYRSIEGTLWVVSSVTEEGTITLYRDSNDEIIKDEGLVSAPFSDGYLYNIQRVSN